MRVITGTAKGFRLYAPKGTETRPALDQVKEAVFNILMNVEQFDVLDLFAGTGSMGIEALSRGAKRCTFVEKSKVPVEYIYRNVKHCHLDDRAQIMMLPVDAAIRKMAKMNQKFDLIFVDPPYLKRLVNATLFQLEKAELLADDGLIVVEHHPKEPIDEIPGFTLTDQRAYGQTLISFLGQAVEKNQLLQQPR
ncbi:MAG: 16S rRNA (guanine(966)-N(2))-methyltransferase RsmD [Deltaproteobacteria bacterium]|nr:16S rRNA (guanine(966)-N(2))-methyltransferase RsmD [Deltaproteobacteria bacterium]